MSHFNVLLIVWAKSQDSFHKPQVLKRRERRADRTEVLLLTSLTPYTTRPHRLDLCVTGQACPYPHLREAGDCQGEILFMKKKSLAFSCSEHLNVPRIVFKITTDARPWYPEETKCV